MKSRTKYLSAAAAVMLCGAAFAAVDDSLVSFATTGDKYADGTDVLDGEWYALCWSATGSFSGLKSDCSLVNDNGEEAVVNIRSRAKNHRCPYTVVQVPAKYSAGEKKDGEFLGKFFLYLLDTRDTSGAVAEKTLSKPAIVNSATCVFDAKVSDSQAARGGTSELNKTGVASVGDATEIPAGVEDPTIAAFRMIDESTAQIDVTGLNAAVRYKVQMGSDLSNIGTYGGALKLGSYTGTEATFEVSLEDAKFFKIVQQPLTEKTVTVE